MENAKGVIMAQDWEQRVYDRYVSTGKLPKQTDPELLFAPARPYFEKVMREHILPSSNISSYILELACGPAPFVYLLKQGGYTQLIGIDTSAEQVALAHAIGLEKEVILGDVDDFLDKASPESFDIVLMFDILEHFSTAEQFALMDKVFTKLKKGGKVILHLPNAEARYGTRVLYGDITHKASFTRRSLEQLMLTVGFQSVRCFEDKPIIHGFISTIRRALWEIVTLWQVFMLAIETGNLRRHAYILSLNMLVVVEK